MPHHAEDHLSNVDTYLIDVHQLGSPLGFFRLKPMYIRFLCGSCLFIVLLGIVSLALFLKMGVEVWQQSLVLHHLHPHTLTDALHVQEVQDRVDSDSRTLFPTFLAGVSGIFAGSLFLGVVTLQTRRERVIACEGGLLQIKWQFRDHVDVVRWEDVLAIKKALFGSSIIRREDKALTFELYQDLDELVAIIKQRSEMASSPQ